MEMVQVVKVFMEKNLKMKIFKLNIKKEDIYLWLMQVQIQMDHNFLFYLKILHILMENM